ncbi:hypothetical protein ACFLTJ_02090 [Chloroflexota bacterium]
MLTKSFIKLPYMLISIALFLVLLGCSIPQSTIALQNSPPEVEPIPEEESKPSQMLENDTPEKPLTSREVISKLWEAMNSYDLERALSYYTVDYQDLEREEVEEDISRLKQFSITLSLKEISEPIIIAKGKVRHEVVLTTPIGERNLIYELLNIDGEWKIYMETMPEKLMIAQEFITDFLENHGESQEIDLMINSEAQGIEPAVLLRALSDLVNSGAIVESEQGLYSLAN